MTLALSHRHYVDYAAERHAAHCLMAAVADACLDERVDDDLVNDTVNVCRKISQNGMIGVDIGSFGEE